MGSTGSEKIKKRVKAGVKSAKKRANPLRRAFNKITGRG